MSFGYDPIGFYEEFLQRERLRLYTEMALRDPRAQAIVPNIPEPPRVVSVPRRVQECDWLPDGDEGFVMAGIPEWGVESVLLIPKYNRYGERTGLRALGKPKLPTRTLGDIEAARYRRRIRKGLSRPL